MAQTFYISQCHLGDCDAQSPEYPTLEHCERWIIAHTQEAHPDDLSRVRESILHGPHFNEEEDDGEQETSRQADPG